MPANWPQDMRERETVAPAPNLRLPLGLSQRLRSTGQPPADTFPRMSAPAMPLSWDSHALTISTAALPLPPPSRSRPSAGFSYHLSSPQAAASPCPWLPPRPLPCLSSPPPPARLHLHPAARGSLPLWIVPLLCFKPLGQNTVLGLGYNILHTDVHSTCPWCPSHAERVRISPCARALSLSQLRAFAQPLP